MTDNAQLYSNTIGSELARARDNQQLSQDDITSILKIKQQLINNIENDNYPSQDIDVFLKGHIIAYCRFLKINHQTILNKLEAKGYNLPIIEESIAMPKQDNKKRAPWMLVCLFFLPVLIFLMTPQKSKPTSNITQPILYGAE